MSRYFRARIGENRPLHQNHNLLSLINLDEMAEPSPGQFYMIGAGKSYDPLLKRAFSLFRRIPAGLQLLYRVRGKGTALLASMREGEVLDVIGPLGNSYPLPGEDKVPVVIGGGIGIASVFSLAERLSRSCHVFYGARMENELFLAGELSDVYENLVLCTDDGSCGIKGTVVDVLCDFMRRHTTASSAPVVYACGPVPMLRRVAETVLSLGVQGYVSLEENMACGIGACLGCVVKTKTGYKRVCREGPIFDVSEILW
ncbi:MAG: dihydroorotate dehydrogenase electron transfer subunit [Candidatus Sulfobium sp.]